MKKFKKLFATVICCAALMLACALPAFAAPQRADLLRYIPTEIVVTSDTVSVHGYFINMNESTAIMDLEDFEMDVYDGEDLIISGAFGTLNSFTVLPQGMVYQEFLWDNDGSYNVGDYTCSDSTYALIGCTFSYME